MRNSFKMTETVRTGPIWCKVFSNEDTELHHARRHSFDILHIYRKELIKIYSLSCSLRISTNNITKECCIMSVHVRLWRRQKGCDVHATMYVGRLLTLHIKAFLQYYHGYEYLMQLNIYQINVGKRTFFNDVRVRMWSKYWSLSNIIHINSIFFHNSTLFVRVYDLRSCRQYMISAHSRLVSVMFSSINDVLCNIFTMRIFLVNFPKREWGVFIGATTYRI